MKKSLNEQAKEIIKMAEESGLQSNFFFLTTFKRYQVQLGILNDLEKAIKAESIQVTKEYVKGSKNPYIHPAISEYNRTTDSANKTVAALIKIIKQLDVGDGGGTEDPLVSLMGGDTVNGGSD